MARSLSWNRNSLQEIGNRIFCLAQRRRKFLLIFSLALAFLFRLAFGLCLDFWTGVEDEKQIYLIGLKFYTTGAWPYFGPDVTNSIQIPGALQGLAIALPFHILPIPEAPYILLNILSFSALCFFAWYCYKRLPQIPKCLVWSWILTAPWTLGLSTHLNNRSYILPGAIVFFVSVIETYPFLSRGLIPLRWANFMMGLALFWIMQFHMSWVLLIPYIALSFYVQFRTTSKKLMSSLMWFACGAIITGSLIIPTLVKYGLAGIGNTNETIQFNRENLLGYLDIVEGILTRFLSFASFELLRFIGRSTATRLDFMKQNSWLIPFIIFLTLVGFLQLAAMCVLWFKNQPSHEDWKAIKYLTLGTVVLLYLSFLFSMKSPLSGTFYVTLPIAMLYSLYCWSEFLKKKRWQKVALVFLICGILFHLGLAVNNYGRVSMYVDRQRMVEALKARDYHLVGERRPGARY